MPNVEAKTYEKLNVGSTANLKTWLTDHFAKPRHHAANPSHKFHTRHEITKLFASFGCEIEKQKFNVSEIHEEESAPKNFASFIRTTTEGFNIICKYPGVNYGTSGDKLLVVIAHFDTDASASPGVNDNGSGSVALLEIARLVGHYNCTRDYTIVFVLTDYEEHGIYKSSSESDEECLAPDEYVHKVGAKHFVCEWLLPQLKRHNIQLISAINLHSLLNTHRSSLSKFPKHIRKMLKRTESGRTFMKQFRNLKGADWILAKNFNLPDYAMHTFEYYWQKYEDIGRHLSMMKLNVQLQPEPDHLYKAEFVHLDDCAAFTGKSTRLPCITVTDTGRNRGYMKTCYHAKCDDLTYATQNNIENIAKMVDILYDSVEALTDSSCTKLPWNELTTDQTTQLTSTEATQICNIPLMQIQTSDARSPSESDVFVTAQCGMRGNKGIMCITKQHVFGILNSDTAWIPSSSKDYRSLWYEVDFRRLVNISAIEIQGISRVGFIKSYLLAYSNQRAMEHWQWYQGNLEDSSSSILPGNVNHRHVAHANIAIRAQYVRIYPYEWKKKPAMQIQIYGC